MIFNYRYKRTGTLWEGRYKATLVENQKYLFACMRYIEMNPVRAAMATKPHEYRWSSYHYNALGIQDLLITPHQEYFALSEDALIRRHIYASMFEFPLSITEINHIREMTNKGWILGSELFKKNIQEKIERPVTPSLKGGDRKSQSYKDKINRV